MVRLPALDLEQMVGQMLYLDLFGEAELELLKRYRAGGVLVRRRCARSARQLMRIISRHQLEAVLPLLVGAGFEYGTGGDVPGGTLFPGPLAIGASGGAASAREYARVTANEASLLGINHALMPVLEVGCPQADLGSVVRCFGEDPLEVARLGEEVVRAFQGKRLLATARHFPALVNAHGNGQEEIPVLGHSKERLRDVELVPFRSAISAGVRCVMLSHVFLPALMGREVQPACMSPAIVQDLLRGELGYQGLVMSANLAAEAVAKRYEPIKACLEAMRAGCDLIHTRQEFLKPLMFQDLVRAVEREPELVRQAERASERILQTKQWLALFDTAKRLPEEATESVTTGAHQRAAHRVALAGTVLYRNRGGLIPIRPAKEQTVLVVTPKLPESPLVGLKDNWGHLYRRIKELHLETRPLYVEYAPSRTELYKTVHAAERADFVVAIVANEAGQSLDGCQAALVNAILKVKPAAVVAVLGNPYAVRALSEEASGVLLTFGNMPASQFACAEVILGKAKPGGRLPVML